MTKTLSGSDDLMRPVSSLKGKYFWVPPYQRGYRWGDEQVEALLNDLHECANLPAGQSYCLQPVVVKERTRRETDDSNSELVPVGGTYFELIDGQQHDISERGHQPDRRIEHRLLPHVEGFSTYSRLVRR